tara:strand:- start:207 stop:1280 length:1074 start_codon:yes stop_codon:yes gene_type:complete
MKFLSLNHQIRLKKILDPEIPVIHSSLRRLLKDKLEIADVGSSGGSPEELNEIFKKCNFMCFDPDTRSFTPKEKNISISPFGLFSSSTKKILFLTKWQEASSIYAPNKKFLDNFLSSDDHTTIKKQEIHLKTLDEVSLNKKFDLLKVDAEGADLEVIKGGKDSLSECLAIKIEIQFKERNIGSPLFGQIDSYLNSHYYLSSLKPFLWLKTKDHYLNSYPELVCGDAIFLRSFESFLEIFNKKENHNKKSFLYKYISLSVLFGAHDSIIYFLMNNNLGLTKSEEKYLLKGIKKSKKNVLLSFSTSFFIVFLFSILLIIFYPFNFIRQKLFLYFKKNISYLGKILSFLGSNPEIGKIKK